jgi:hypothetical protein
LKSKKEEKGIFKQPLFTPDQSSISGTLFTPETTISSIKTGTPHSNFFTPDLNSNFLSGPSSINSILNTPIGSSQPKESVKNLFSTPEITSKQKEFTSKISEGAPPVVKRKQKIHTKTLDSKIQKLTPLKDLEDAFFNPSKDDQEEEEDISMMTLLTILGEGYKLFSEFVIIF